MTRHFALILSLTILAWGVHSEPVPSVDQQGKGLPLKGAISKLQEKELLLKELEELAKEEVMDEGSDGTNSVDYSMPQLTEKTSSVPLEPMSPDDQQANELPADEDEPLSNLQEAKILLRELEELAKEERMTENNDDMSVLAEKRTSGLLDPNVAAGRPASQSSTAHGGSPGRAVDGGRSSHWGHNSCTHTHAETNPWWYVDLGKAVTVDHVAIINRLDCCAERITPLDVHVGQSTDVARNARCGDHHRFPPGQSELTVDCNGKRGRYVGIRLPGNQRILTLCEVEVYAAPNRALGRPSVQSSVGWSGFPPRAVDGCRDPNYDQQCCTHTQAQTNPYWYVDLGSQRRVQWVVVTNRQDCCHERLSPFTIHVGNSPNVASNPRCGGHHTIPAGKDKDAINCNGMRGRYVGIRLPGHGRILTLCEVEVYEGSGYKKRTSDVRGIEGQGCGEHEEGDAWVSDEDKHNCICDMNEAVCTKVDCGENGEQDPIKDEDGMWSCPEIPDVTSEEELEPEIPDETGRAMVGELPA